MFKKLLLNFKKGGKTMDTFNSEALEKGVKPNKAVEKMTPQEIQEFLSKIDPDMMGFLGREGADEDEN